MSGQQRIAGRLGSHLAVPQDKMWQHGEYRLAARALNMPNGEPAEPNPSIMGMAGQTPAVTGRFVLELKPKREEKGENELHEGLAIA